MELRNRQRLFLSIFFFISGVCFSSWASRIPTIKSAFGYNEAELGTVLLFMPISSLIGLPVSGWLVSRYDSRVPMSFAFVILALALMSIGFATSDVVLITSICVFSFTMRVPSRLADAEMFRAFNMGVGMVAIVDPAAADTLLDQLAASGENAWVAGEIVAGEREVILS